MVGVAQLVELLVVVQAVVGSSPIAHPYVWDTLVDYQKLLNTPHVPEDAGEHAEAFARMLARIPDGWGRWISCNRGWYELLVELDEQLSALFPSYIIHQVKEKFGGLRVYWESGEAIHDPNDPEPPTPGREGDEEEWEAWKERHAAWDERLDAYLKTPEGKARDADLKRRVELADKLVNAAEARAAVTCEICGKPGQMHRTRGAWYKTLCQECAQRKDYIPASE